MYLTRKDIIETIKNAFNEYGYRSAIDKRDKRLRFGFGIARLSNADCSALNEVVKKLNSQMLKGVNFDVSMRVDNFDRNICRLLYVSGNWIELCYYQMFIKDASNLYYVNVCNKTETHITVFFTTKDSNICMSVDDQKVGIKLVITIKEEKGF